MIRALSSAYGAAAAWRRRWYEANPARQRRLERPVISVGNLRVGGSGKTPLVSYIAKLLLAEGQRPAILTRGYGRRRVSPGVTVVSDGKQLLADLDSAGDEPLLLARQLPEVPVLVGADRYESGRLAETTLGATVHILDDGFQHLKLARGTDLLLVDKHDLADRPMPAGHLRESLAAAASADAVLTEAEGVGRALRVSPVFRITRSLGTPRLIPDDQEPAIVLPGARIFAVAGIARPERFFADLASLGCETAGTMAFRDHHPYTRRDTERIVAAARAASASIVLTTEKDAVRLAPYLGGDEAARAITPAVPFAFLPLLVSVEPAGAFRQWLMERLR